MEGRAREWDGVDEFKNRRMGGRVDRSREGRWSKGRIVKECWCVRNERHARV